MNFRRSLFVIVATLLWVSQLQPAHAVRLNQCVTSQTHTVINLGSLGKQCGIQPTQVVVKGNKPKTFTTLDATDDLLKGVGVLPDNLVIPVVAPPVVNPGPVGNPGGNPGGPGGPPGGGGGMPPVGG